MTRSRRNPLQRMNYVLLLALSGCGTQQSTPASPCAWGSEVKIPEVDSTRPTWAIDFHMPNNTTVSYTGTSGAQVFVPMDGPVTVVGVVRDSEGVKSAELGATEHRCASDAAGNVTCELLPPDICDRDAAAMIINCELPPGYYTPPGPPPGPPNNPDLASVGKIACTEGVVKRTITVLKGNGLDYWSVFLIGRNYGQLHISPLFIVKRVP